jgi:hypothetical protein
VLALTLPEDTLSALHKIHPDTGRAIVKLVDGKYPSVDETQKRPIAELVSIGGVRSLIVVDRWAFRNLQGVSLIPVSDDRAFLALETGRDIDSLALAVVDRLEELAADEEERKALKELHACLRQWRHDRSIAFISRSIIIVERGSRRSGPARHHRPVTR